MRRTDANGRTGQNFMITMKRTCSLVVISLSLGLAMSAGPARAGDDDRTFTEKVSDGFYGMIRGTNMDNRGIDYRERSPLVVPPTLDLPPPASASADVPIANWPKDPDERQRKAVIAAKKKNAPPPARVQVTAAGGQVQPINIAPPVEPQQAARSRARRVRPMRAIATARLSPIRSMTSRAICSLAAPRIWPTTLAWATCLAPPKSLRWSPVLNLLAKP